MKSIPELENELKRRQSITLLSMTIYERKYQSFLYAQEQFERAKVDLAKCDSDELEAFLELERMKLFNDSIGLKGDVNDGLGKTLE